MKSVGPTRASIAAAILLLCFCASSWGQDSGQSPSLGDVARKSRKERSSVDHVAAKQVMNEDQDGPDSAGVWRLHACTHAPCLEASITLPKSLKWTRSLIGPHPVLISLDGPEEDPSHAIRVYAEDGLSGVLYAGGYFQDAAKRDLLQGLFARPEYFGQAAHLVLDEHVQVDTHPATVTHFTIASDTARYRGLSIVTASTSGSFGFACAYREEDAKDAASICDGIIRSARIEIQQQYKPQARPEYPQPFPVYRPRVDDPPDDDERDDSSDN
jgi:hypothetical protein